MSTTSAAADGVAVRPAAATKSSLPFISRTSRAAVFRPIPGMRVSRSTFPEAMAFSRASGGIVLRIERAAFGPIPETVSNDSKSRSERSSGVP